MLRSLNNLEASPERRRSDGDIGSVVNFLFDDDHWTVRYLVVKSGGYFSRRQVLLSAHRAPVFREFQWAVRSGRYRRWLGRGVVEAPAVAAR